MRRLVCAAALLLGCSAATAAWAQTVDVTVDGSSPGAPIERIWAFHGYDEANYTTLPEGRALLQTLGAIHTTPPHVRMHFLLNTGDGTPSMKWGSTNVYTEDAAGSPVYTWTLTDSIFDTLTGAGALPFVEIAFMPQALSAHPTPYQNSTVTALDGGAFYPPKDYAKWGQLISAWAGHLNTRYPNVAGSWLWELWNEPDISYFHGTAAEYQKLYDYTEAAIHTAIPTAPLGGPAVAVPTSSFLPQFLQHCATGTNAVTGKTGTRLDLVTFHAKGGSAVVNGHIEMDLGHQLTLHKAGFSAVAAVAPFKKLPIYVTEADPDGCAACAGTATSADGYRFSPAYGAYEVAMMKHTLELEDTLGVKVGGLVAWAFTFPGSAYFSGYRVLATNGIEMPVLGAFRLLGALAGARLPVTSTGAIPVASIVASSVRAAADVDAMATLDGGKLQVLLWNYHDDIVTAPPATVQVAVKVPASFGSAATVTHLRMDDTHGDAYTVWKSQGSPQPPSPAQLQALQAAMLPQALGAPQMLPVTGGTVTVTFSLPRFGVSLLTLSPAAGAVDAGAGAVDAGRRDGAVGPTGGRGGGASGTGGQGGSAGADGSGQTGGVPDGGGGGNGNAGSGGCSCDLADGVARPAVLLLFLLFLFVLSARARRARP
ncbi:MAG: GH39 family glycosyl hydrolase [Polyangia bacterium]